MKDLKTLGTGLALGLLVAMAFGQSKAPTPAATGATPKFQISAVQTGATASDANVVLYVLDNRTQAVSVCRNVNGKWESASAFQLPE